MRDFDSKAWTGRDPNRWWNVEFVSRHLAFHLGWDFQTDWFGLRIAVVAVKDPKPFERRYKFERLFRFWPRYSHYRRGF